MLRDLARVAACVAAVCGAMVVPLGVAQERVAERPQTPHEAVPFEWDVTVPPGGYAVASFDPTTGRTTTRVVSPLASGPTFGPDDPRQSAVLTESARKAVAAVPADMRRDLALKFADLRTTAIRIEGGGGNAHPAFADLDADGRADLLVTNDAQQIVAGFLSPDWRPASAEILARANTGNLAVRVMGDIDGDGADDMITRGPAGEISITPTAANHAPFTVDSPAIRADVVGVALGDVDGDGLADLVLGTKTGEIRVFVNRGDVTGNPFVTYRTDAQNWFPMDFGLAAVPAIVGAGMDAKLIVGTQESGLRVFVRNPDANANSPWREATVHDANRMTPLNLVPAVVYASPASAAMIVGQRDGSLLRAEVREVNGDFVFDIDVRGGRVIAENFGTYAAPAIGDLNGDRVPDIVAGTREGRVIFVPGLLTRNARPVRFSGVAEALPGIENVPSGVPCIIDATNILFGRADGTLALFRFDAGEETWVDATADSPFAGIDVGEYAAPTFGDLDGDGVAELVVGNGRGKLTAFMRDESADGVRYIEWRGWSFEPMGGADTIADFYARYFPETIALRSPADDAAVDAFANELLHAPANWRDEIGFCIAHTPTEVLRAMHRLGQADLFTRNARAMYALAAEVEYAWLTDDENGTRLDMRTASGWAAVPRDAYYRFVVHPRVMFELPARLDASWWRTTHTERGMNHEEWLRHDEGLMYGTDEPHKFWREAFPIDEKHGRQLLDDLRQCKTQKDAVFAVQRFQSWAEPTGFMSFGYATNDLQPWLIYEKAYGSCGEQSILQTALCRTALIPTFVVGCRGEDHQWAEFWRAETQRWTHWDINNPARCIGQPWVSGEGDHHGGKTISTIIAFGPDDQYWATTNTVDCPPGSGYMPDDRGYTPTARVEIRVVDAAGSPIDGAMITARSHWNNAGMMTFYVFTDLDGRARFDLGWEPFGGYTFDVATPFGMAGSMNFPVHEGENYSITYTVPGTKPARAAVKLADENGATIAGAIRFSREARRSQIIYPRSFFTGQRYRMSSLVTQASGYTGTRWLPMNLASDEPANLLVMDAANVARFAAGQPCEAVPFGENLPAGCADREWFLVADNRAALHVWQQVQVAFDRLMPAAPPKLDLDRAQFDIRAGETATITGRVTDASGIARFEFSEDGGETWQAVGDANGNGIADDGRFRLAWPARASRTLLGGEFAVVLRAVDAVGTSTTVGPVVVNVAASRHFPRQRIFADDPNDPLSAGWVLGPFRVPADERCISIRSVGHTASLDMDLFLFSDANGNRRLDGMGERLAASTTPTANENIFIDNPDTSRIYWIYMQGWSVPDDGGDVSLELSFAPQAAWLADLAPVGIVSEKPEKMTAKLARALPAGWSVTVGRHAADNSEVVRPDAASGAIEFAFGDDFAGVKLDEMWLAVRDAEGREIDRAVWGVRVDALAPQISGAVAALDAATGQTKVTVRASDDVQLRGVSAKVADGPSANLAGGRNADVPDEFAGSLNLRALPAGRVEIVITATDAAGRTASVAVAVDVPEWPAAPAAPVRLQRVTPSGTWYDPQPLFQTYLDVDDGVIPTHVAVVVTDESGRVVLRHRERMDGRRVLQWRPDAPLPLGKYVAHFEVLVDGVAEPIRHSQPFAVGRMDESKQRR